ncbi:FkbM family methyltransferase [Flagellimonas allohymeniacidonis]|uniref:FkbM family methyltransferase n=1 Tax=Flagellimonas allohymeniacidonis TaxID=2517819 RepID=A0A4Q8QG37_9FLAO|nr:FkbM family methyltransferase [Allomuricauda hymeniacidonis]TAI47543.1 FkbM family methyltransferase [Allomuricauda hymeniacidonis]
MRFLLHLYRYIKTFGMKGVEIFFKIKFEKTDNVFLPNSPVPFTLRRHTSDLPTFRHIFLEKQYEIALGFEPEFIIDAGANIGLAAIYFVNKYPDTKIACIEPEDSNFEMLEQNVHGYPNIECHKNALSNIDGETISLIDSGQGKWGFMTEKTENFVDGNIASNLTTISIPHLMELYNLTSIDVVKIDIEGAEKELFESNFEDWLPKTRCLIIELHDRKKPGCSKSLFKAVSQYDFIFSHKGENLIFLNAEMDSTTK